MAPFQGAIIPVPKQVNSIIIIITFLHFLPENVQKWG